MRRLSRMLHEHRPLHRNSSPTAISAVHLLSDRQCWLNSCPIFYHSYIIMGSWQPDCMNILTNRLFQLFRNSKSPRCNELQYLPLRYHAMAVAAPAWITFDALISFTAGAIFLGMYPAASATVSRLIPFGFECHFSLIWHLFFLALLTQFLFASKMCYSPYQNGATDSSSDDRKPTALPTECTSMIGNTDLAGYCNMKLRCAISIASRNTTSRCSSH